MVAPPFGYHPATNERHEDGESVTTHATRALGRRLCTLVAILALAGVAAPAPVVANGGEGVTLRGTVRKVIADDFAGHRSETTWFLETEAGRVPLEVPAGQVPEVASGGATVTGRRLADGSVRVDTIVPEAAPEARSGTGTDVQDGTRVLAGTSWAGPAVRRIAVVVGTYTDLPLAPGSAAGLMPALSGPTGSIRSLIEASSRGRVSVSATVYGPWALGINSCGAVDAFSATIDAVEKQAESRGVSLASYDHVIMWTPAPCGRPWIALGEAPGTYIQTNAPYPDTGDSRLQEFAWTASHEMGHNMGLLHANALACEDASGEPVAFGTSCEAVEYGDPFSTMGGNEGYLVDPTSWAFLSPLFSAEELARLGWLDPTEIQTVTGSGTYDLVPLYGAGPGVRLLRMRRSTPVIADDPTTWQLRSGWLTVELRSGSPDGTWDTFPDGSPVTSGVIVRYAEDGYEDTGFGVVPQHGPEYVVDAHPATVGRRSWDVELLDTPLGVRDPVQLVDPATGYQLGLVSRTSNGASVTFAGTPPPVAYLDAPVITAAMSAGQAVTVTWAEPAATAGLEVTGYTVRSYPGGRLCAVGAAPRSCLVEGLTSGVPYRFTVTATFDDPATGPFEGFWSTSDPSQAVTLPAPPTASITPLAVYRSTQSIAVRWSGSDNRGPVDGFDVRYRSAPWNGTFGGYTKWLSGTTATSATLAKPAVGTGRTYCFSARARAGLRESTWTAETCTAVPLDDRSLTRSLGWTRISGATYYRSTAVRSYSFSRSLTRTGVVAKRVALVASTCPTCGSVRVYWNGVRVKTISLRSSTRRNRVLLGALSFGSVRTGTLKLVVGTSSRRVKVDGVAISRR